MSKPKVAIVDWRDHPRGDELCEIEKNVIGKDADIFYHLVRDNNDWFSAPSSLRDATVVVLWHNAPCSAEAISTLENCKVIIRNGVGYDTVDLEAARYKGITVCNIPDYGTEEVANHSIALALALTRQLFPLDRHAKNLNWEMPQHVLENINRYSEMFFSIIGLGRIGRSVAQKADALGFNVLYYDPFVDDDKFTKFDSLNEMLCTTDVLSIHCPLNSQTKYMITNQELDLLKNTSYVINTARGAIVNKRSILNALNGGRLAGAGLDVVEDEPLRTKDEAKTSNLICTCHAAFYSKQSVIDMRTKSANLAKAAINGNELYNIVS